jgi:hypothetical protein
MPSRSRTPHAFRKRSRLEHKEVTINSCEDGERKNERENEDDEGADEGVKQE